MYTPFGKYLSHDMIAFLDDEMRDDVIKELIRQAYQAGRLSSPQNFYDAVIDREKVVTTGIGMGVAIPHAKLPHFDDFFISIGIMGKGIDWEALDGHPVRLIFLIGGPDDKQTEYLQLLSSLTLTLKNDEMRKGLLNAKTPEEVCQLFT